MKFLFELKYTKLVTIIFMNTQRKLLKSTRVLRFHEFQSKHIIRKINTRNKLIKNIYGFECIYIFFKFYFECLQKYEHVN